MDAVDYCDVLHAFLRQRSIDPMKTVALAWAVRATSGVDVFTRLSGLRRPVRDSRLGSGRPSGC